MTFSFGAARLWRTSSSTTNEEPFFCLCIVKPPSPTPQRKPLLERTPFKAPLECYGTGPKLSDDRCRECPHQSGCITHAGRLHLSLALSDVCFDLMPNKKMSITVVDDEDPDAVNIQAVYKACYFSIFQSKPHPSDIITPYRDVLVARAAKKGISLQLYLASAMMGFHLHQDSATGQAKAVKDSQPEETVERRKCYAENLVSSRAMTHVDMYAEMCRKKYSSFSAYSLSAVDRTGIAPDATDKEILHSEIIAGQFISSYKALKGGPAEPSLYAQHELTLSPIWLALEPSYKRLVLDCRAANESRAQKYHRYDVIQQIKTLKSAVQLARGAHLARAKIMPAALKSVLQFHRMDMEDFMAETRLVTDAFQFWKDLGRAIQHYRCLVSYFQQRGPY